MAKNNNKNSPENRSAQYLANLMGTNVAGFEPQRTPQSIQEDQKAEQIIADLLSGKRKEEAIDIEKCITDHPVWPYDTDLPFIVIAFILREEDTSRATFLGDINPEVFKNEFARYLFLMIKKLHQENQFSIEKVQNSIDICGPEVFGYELSHILRLAYYSQWFHTLATYPTVQQFDITLSRLRENKAKRK